MVSYHLRRNSFDGRDSYYHLDLDRCTAELAETGADGGQMLLANPAGDLIELFQPAHGSQ